MTCCAAGACSPTHLPGPDGLPGGYPVTIDADKVTVRLPPFFTVAQATEANQRWAWRDGVQLSPGRLTFAPRIACLLAACFPMSRRDSRSATSLRSPQRSAACGPLSGHSPTAGRPRKQKGTEAMPSHPTVRNALYRYYDRIRAAASRLSMAGGPPGDFFQPGWELPDPDGQLAEFFAVSALSGGPLT